MIKTLFCFIPIQYTNALDESVVAWEAQNKDYTAIVVGAYKAPALTEFDDAFVIIGKNELPISILLENGLVQDIAGFCLVADDNQLSPYMLNQIGAIGKIFETPEEYKEFELTL
jgi:hypothetical protein